MDCQSDGNSLAHTYFKINDAVQIERTLKCFLCNIKQVFRENNHYDNTRRDYRFSSQVSG